MVYYDKCPISLKHKNVAVIYETEPYIKYNACFWFKIKTRHLFTFLLGVSQTLCHC